VFSFKHRRHGIRNPVLDFKKIINKNKNNKNLVYPTRRMHIYIHTIRGPFLIAYCVLVQGGYEYYASYLIKYIYIYIYIYIHMRIYLYTSRGALLIAYGLLCRVNTTITLDI